MSKYIIVKGGKLVDVAEHLAEALTLQQKHGGIIEEGEWKSFPPNEWTTGGVVLLDEINRGMGTCLRKLEVKNITATFVKLEKVVREE